MPFWRKKTELEPKDIEQIINEYSAVVEQRKEWARALTWQEE